MWSHQTNVDCKLSNIEGAHIMSIGAGGSARIIMQDADVVIYEYYAYSLNEEKYQNTEHIYDGVITIRKNSLIEPETHERVKKMPSAEKS